MCERIKGEIVRTFENVQELFDMVYSTAVLKNIAST